MAAPALSDRSIIRGVGAVVVLPLALYLASGLLNGFLAADDFGWLTTARDGDWQNLFTFGGYDHFYRPVIRLWFAGAVRVCGDSSACYHSLNLSVHAANTLLFAVLSTMVTRDRWFAVLAAAIFAVSPGYVEAVAWVSAVTELLSTLFVLATAICALKVSTARTSTLWYVAATTALLALFAHEAAVSLFLIVPLVFLMAGRLESLRPRAIWPFAVVAALFAAVVVIANQRDTIVTQDHYALGSHAIGHAQDYLVSMYVGPHRFSGRVFVVVAVGLITWLGPPMARAGIMWIIAALLPFVFFTAGNASRYLYLPTMGFGWVMAALLLALRSEMSRRLPARVATVTAAVLAVAVIVRLSIFTSKAIAERVDWMNAYREYAMTVVDLQSTAAATGELVVPRPTDPRVDVASIQPMLRWTRHSPELAVAFDGPER